MPALVDGVEGPATAVVVEDLVEVSVEVPVVDLAVDLAVVREEDLTTVRVEVEAARAVTRGETTETENRSWILELLIMHPHLRFVHN